MGKPRVKVLPDLSKLLQLRLNPRRQRSPKPPRSQRRQSLPRRPPNPKRLRLPKKPPPRSLKQLSQLRRQRHPRRPLNPRQLSQRRLLPKRRLPLRRPRSKLDFPLFNNFFKLLKNRLFSEPLTDYLREFICFDVY